MIQSVCILGRQPALGLAELESLYGGETVSRIAQSVAGVDLEADHINFARLGGSTRVAKVLSELPNTNWKLVEKELAKLLRSMDIDGDSKITLGLSAFGFDMTPAKLTAAGLTLKKILRSTGRSVRLTPNPALELNTAQVIHNKLTQPGGVELLCIATSDGKTVIAQTTAVQNIESYTLRDRGRPKRDARVGMLPPKLAQIIINLAAGQKPATPDTIVLDPFCGTGVILQEAMLMGYSAHGTDLEPRMIDFSRKNIEWIRTETDTLETNFELEAADATYHQWNPLPAFIASEAYLGRPFTATPTREILTQTATDVNAILTKSLRNIRSQLPSGTRLCLAVPAWQIGTDTFRHLRLLDSLEEIGYNRVEFEHVLESELLYYREDQIVARELLVLTRK